jgi:hypothetical protein
MKFIMNTSFIIWGIIGLAMAIACAVSLVIGFAIHSIGDFYICIALILSFIFCGIKLIVNGYKLRFVVDDHQMICKTILGKYKCILWKDIDNVTLEKSPASIVVNSLQQTISVPLTLKNWEVLLEIIEDHVADDKFIGFD